jgi:hypothetical protein
VKVSEAATKRKKRPGGRSLTSEKTVVIHVLLTEAWTKQHVGSPAAREPTSPTEIPKKGTIGSMLPT